MEKPKFDIDDFELITAITMIYQNDIEVKILNNKDEVLQTDVANIVYELFLAYTKLSAKGSLLNFVNQKHIGIDEL